MKPKVLAVVEGLLSVRLELRARLRARSYRLTVVEDQRGGNRVVERQIIRLG